MSRIACRADRKCFDSSSFEGWTTPSQQSPHAPDEEERPASVPSFWSACYSRCGRNTTPATPPSSHFSPARSYTCRIERFQAFQDPGSPSPSAIGTIHPGNNSLSHQRSTNSGDWEDLSVMISLDNNSTDSADFQQRRRANRIRSIPHRRDLNLESTPIVLLAITNSVDMENDEGGNTSEDHV